MNTPEDPAMSRTELALREMWEFFSRAFSFAGGRESELRNSGRSDATQVAVNESESALADFVVDSDALPENMLAEADQFFPRWVTTPQRKAFARQSWACILVLGKLKENTPLSDSEREFADSIKAMLERTKHVRVDAFAPCVTDAT